MKIDVTIGWDGKCAEHRSMPSLGRRTQTVAVFEHKDCGRTLLGNVLQIHCAAGHQYYAIDLDEIIHDPFSEDEEADIWGDEGFPLPPDGEELE